MKARPLKPKLNTQYVFINFRFLHLMASSSSSLFLTTYTLNHQPLSTNFLLPFSLPQNWRASCTILHKTSFLLLSSLSATEFSTTERNPENLDTKQKKKWLRKEDSRSSAQIPHIQSTEVETIMKRKSKKNKDKLSSVEIDFRVKLDMCSKSGDVLGAISLYDFALEEGINLEQYHYNVLLYLCSSASIGTIYPAKSGNNSNNNSNSSDDEANNDSCFSIQVTDEVRLFARKRGFEIYEQMCLRKVPLTEAALTSVARMAMSMNNGDMAFDIVKQMISMNITPRLRSYDPALFAFCNNGDIDKAFEVEKNMLEHGVLLEEPELEALLKASVSACKGDKVYYLLHKLRTNVRQVSKSISDIIEQWFGSSNASRVGKRKVDESVVKDKMVNSGGGWHGLGWLGKGKWKVERSSVDDHGVCLCCGEQLVTIDLDPIETENFAKSIASIANKREGNSNFEKFQRWLDYYGPFEAVVDAANVGLFSQRQFSLMKVNAVVNAIRQKLPTKKWPLIIVHNRRLMGHKMSQSLNEKLIEKWKNADAIYATPTGSNDDWYWLYAAIKCKSLIVTNDEMRDHVFQLLGNEFIPKWKERHQVHFNFRDGNFEFQMPPPCSVVIQESEKGHWHIPIADEHDSSNRRIWLCVTRPRTRTAFPVKSIRPEEACSEKTRQTASKAKAKDSGNLYEKKMAVEDFKHIAIKKFTNFSAIVNDIEAGEKISGHVIDFQI